MPRSIARTFWRAPRLYCLAAWLLALVAQSASAQAAPWTTNCAGGRFIASVETIQRQNWIEKAPTVYDQKQTSLRLPAWLGALRVTHASQGFLLSGEERLGRWTTVTVPPSLTLRMRLFGRAIYWPVKLPVFKETQACRDANGDLYVR